MTGKAGNPGYYRLFARELAQCGAIEADNQR